VPAVAVVTAADDCDPAPIVTAVETRTDGDCPFRYTLTRTWTGTDRCGNSAVEQQVIEVVDTTPPVLAAPGDLTVECPAPATGPDSLLAWSSSGTATDNCGVPAVEAVEVALEPGCGETFVSTWEMWAVDECGNESPRVTRVYAVVDTTPPVLAAPSDLTVECPAPASGPDSEAAWLASAAASDTCGDAQVLAQLLEEVDGCGDTFTHVWELWAVDECGNESARVQRTYEVVDTTPPAFTGGEPPFDFSLWPPNHGYVVYEADELVAAIDLCGEVAIAVTGCHSSQPEEVHQGSTDDGGNGDGRFGEDCVLSEDGELFAVRAERLGACGPDAVRTYSVEVTATDECGNAATTTGLIRVEHDRSGKPPVRRGRKLGPNDPPPFPHVHPTTYGDGCD
jgi:hypothetical protein